MLTARRVYKYLLTTSHFFFQGALPGMSGLPASQLVGSREWVHIFLGIPQVYQLVIIGQAGKIIETHSIKFVSSCVID